MKTALIEISPIIMYFVRVTETKVSFLGDILDLMTTPASLPTFNLSAGSKIGLSLTHLFQEGESVPGSTDGILLMGIIIVLIIVLPIVWTRRKWMR